MRDFDFEKVFGDGLGGQPNPDVVKAWKDKITPEVVGEADKLWESPVTKKVIATLRFMGKYRESDLKKFSARDLMTLGGEVHACVKAFQVFEDMIATELFVRAGMAEQREGK